MICTVCKTKLALSFYKLKYFKTRYPHATSRKEKIQTSTTANQQTCALQWAPKVYPFFPKQDRCLKIVNSPKQ